MTEDIEKIIDELLNSSNDFSIDDIPDMDLYMDQVLTLINSKFDDISPDSDKQLTKTMINNYAKSKLIPAPVKKKYSKDHVILLILINFYKSIMSINDTDTLISPLVEQHFHNDKEPLSDIISKALEHTGELSSNNDIKELFKKCNETFDFDGYENADYLKTVAFIHILSYQAYTRQKLISKLVAKIQPVNTNDGDKSK